MKKTLKSVKARSARRFLHSLDGVVSNAVKDMKRMDDLAPVRTVRVGDDVLVVRLVNPRQDEANQAPTKRHLAVQAKRVRALPRLTGYVDQSVEDTERAVQTLTNPPSDEAQEIYRRLLEIRPA